MGILAWIILGAAAGWIASLIMGTDAQQGAVANIIIGILGAIIGGFTARFLGIGEDGIDFDFGSFVLAVLGACALLFVVKAAQNRD